MREISDNESNLEKAAKSYSKAANCLKYVWKNSPTKMDIEIDRLNSISRNIEDAKLYEQAGIDYIKRFLSKG